MTPRRELAGAVLLAAVAGGLGLLAGSRPWYDLTVVRDSPLPPAEATVAGSTVSPLVPGLALVVLAAAGGLLATRRWGRVVIGLVVVAAGVGIFVATAPWLGEVSGSRLQELAAAVNLPSGAVGDARGDGPLVALAAAALAVLTGALTAARSRRWPALGSRYDAPAPTARPSTPGTPGSPAATPASDREVWDALDRGEDPTQTR